MLLGGPKWFKAEEFNADKARLPPEGKTHSIKKMLNDDVVTSEPSSWARQMAEDLEPRWTQDMSEDTSLFDCLRGAEDGNVEVSVEELTTEHCHSGGNDLIKMQRISLTNIDDEQLHTRR